MERLPSKCPLAPIQKDGTVSFGPIQNGVSQKQGVVGGCKKLSKRMAMQSNCDGSSREFESQKNNELSAASGERIKILILMFLPPRRVVEPIV